MTLPDAKEDTLSMVNSSQTALKANIKNLYKCKTEEHISITVVF